MAVNNNTLRRIAGLIILFSCVSHSPSMGCSSARLMSNPTVSRSRDVGKMGVRIYFKIDVLQVSSFGV